MNFFITGAIQTGKTTALSRVIDGFSGSIAGFETYSGFEKGNGLCDVYIKPFGSPPVYDGAHKICERLGFGERRSFPEVFEAAGVSILREALLSGPGLIVMDEIGIMEEDANEFKKMIIRCLDSEITILGTLRMSDSRFLNEIRGRHDVDITELSVGNRDILPDIIKKKYEACKKNSIHYSTPP